MKPSHGTTIYGYAKQSMLRPLEVDMLHWKIEIDMEVSHVHTENIIFNS